MKDLALLVFAGGDETRSHEDTKGHEEEGIHRFRRFHGGLGQGGGNDADEGARVRFS